MGAWMLSTVVVEGRSGAAGATGLGWGGGG